MRGEDVCTMSQHSIWEATWSCSFVGAHSCNCMFDLSVIGSNLKIGGGYLSVRSCCVWTPCDGKKDLKSSKLLWLLSVTFWGWPLLGIITRGGILVQLPSVEGPDVNWFTDQNLALSVASNHSSQYFCFVAQMRLVVLEPENQTKLWC